MTKLQWLFAGALTLSILDARPIDAQENGAKQLPEFSLKTADGESVSAKFEGGELMITRKEATAPPKAVLLHFFQPDCDACLAEMKLLEGLHKEFVEKGALVASVAHRGDKAAVIAVAEELKLTLPLLLGQESDLAKAFARGDATVIADAKGVIRYSQVGFKEGDEKFFRETLENLLAGKDVTIETNERRRLSVGEAFPAVRLSSLFAEKPMTLTVEAGKLMFQDDSGETVHAKAAVGFFSRY